MFMRKIHVTALSIKRASGGGDKIQNCAIVSNSSTCILKNVLIHNKNLLQQQVVILIRRTVSVCGGARIRTQTALFSMSRHEKNR